LEPGFIALDGVSHRYGGANAGPDDVIAVQDLSLSVARGEFAAVVGPSGCGKSTLMKLVTGLQFPFAGHVAGCKPNMPVFIGHRVFSFYNFIKSKFKTIYYTPIYYNGLINSCFIL